MLRDTEPTNVATVTAVASSATSQTVLADKVRRKGLIVHNTDVNACLLKYGATASASSYTYRIEGGTHWGAYDDVGDDIGAWIEPVARPFNADLGGCCRSQRSIRLC